MHILSSRKFPVPVISVGNMTVGGTGKTPFVEYLVRECLKSGKKVAVISRGYKRTTKGTVIVSDGVSILADAHTAGDEAFQIAKKFPKIVVIVDERRPRGAAIAIDRYGVEVILLDDGFQHRAISRDLDIVMVNPGVPLAEIRMLPAGLRREPLRGIRRGNCIVTMESLGERNNNSFSTIPKLIGRYSAAKFVRISGRIELPLHTMLGKQCTAICGIGNPLTFRTMLQQLGLKIDHFITYPDHHLYTKKDLESLLVIMKGNPESILITTEKDAVKFQQLQPGDSAREWYYLEIETQVVEGEDLLLGELHRLLQRAA